MTDLFLKCLVLSVSLAAITMATTAAWDWGKEIQSRCQAQTVLLHKSRLTGQETRVLRKVDSAPVVYFSGMAIDADGAPNAYHPDNLHGLDDLKHAGDDANWWALVLDKRRNPVVQQSGEFAGYYVSMTWLEREDGRFPPTDPKHWIDARVVPYIAVPRTVLNAGGIGKGDLAYVVNEMNGASSFAIVADLGTENTLGEGSIALAESLRLESSDPRYGGQEKGISYVIFPRSATNPPWPRDVREMSSTAETLFTSWGGEHALSHLRSFSR